MSMKNIIRTAMTVFVLLSYATVVYAGASDIYSVGGNGFTQIGVDIAGYVVYIAGACAVGRVIVLGIQFILSAPNGKANAAKKIVPWAVGVVLLFSMHYIVNKAAEIGRRNSIILKNT